MIARDLPTPVDDLAKAREIALTSNLVVIPRRISDPRETQRGPWLVMRRTSGRLVLVGERSSPDAVLALVRRAAGSTKGAPA